VRWYESLRRQSDFIAVRRRGRRANFPTLAAYALDGSGASRIGVTVSKAVGGAVVRNLVRRRIQGALDGATPGPAALRLVLVAKPEAASEPYERLARDVAAALARLAPPPA
jgi:ribonuclease P protein component